MKASAHPLDCSYPPAAMFWALLGALVAAAVLTVQRPPNAASLLRVGSTNPLLKQFERELGPVNPIDPRGHDGQIYYMVARDPFAQGETVVALTAFDTNSPRYRYRRILYPLLAGGAGLFSPRVTLVGLIVGTIVGMALMVVGVADSAYTLNAPGGAAFTAMLNLGAVVSVMLLTADALALGLALCGVALALRGRQRFACLFFALAALTKETYILVPIGLAAVEWQRGHRANGLKLVLSAAAPVGLWSVFVTTVVPRVQATTRNLGVPFLGLMSSVGGWFDQNPIQAVFASFCCAMLLLCASAVSKRRRHTMFMWLIIPWLSLAVVSTSAVWGFPTNAARAFAILWPISFLAIFARFSEASEAIGEPTFRLGRSSLLLKIHDSERRP